VLWQETAKGKWRLYQTFWDEKTHSDKIETDSKGREIIHKCKISSYENSKALSLFLNPLGESRHEP